MCWSLSAGLLGQRLDGEWTDSTESGRRVDKDSRESGQRVDTASTEARTKERTETGQMRTTKWAWLQKRDVESLAA